MQIIERRCEAQKGACIRSNLNFYVVLWTVGEKTLDKLTDQPGNLKPLDIVEVPDLSVSGDNSDLAEDDPCDIVEVPDLSVSGDNSDLAEDDPCDPTTTSKPESPMQSLNQLSVVTDLADARSI